MVTQAVMQEIRPSLSAIHDARKFLAGYFSPTRLVAAGSLSRATGKHVHLKLETDLPTASFKVRGALYALAKNLQKEPVREVVASSTGNHGAAVAYAANLLGVKATIFLPENCNPVKRERIASLGATIVERGKDISDAFEEVARYAQDHGAYLLNDATDEDLPAGPGTIGCEILEQLPSVSTIFVPMGDTALIRGIAAAAKQISPGVRIVGVQSDQAPAYYLSWEKGEAVCTETCDTIADGLSSRVTVPANVRAIRQLVDEVVLVSDRQMLDAIARLLFDEQVLAEPSGAATTAAMLGQGSQAGENVVLVVTGANISRDVLERAICIPPEELAGSKC
jgi:threonine dehydratase